MPRLLLPLHLQSLLSYPPMTDIQCQPALEQHVSTMGHPTDMPLAQSIQQITDLLRRYLNLGDLQRVGVKLSLQAGSLRSPLVAKGERPHSSGQNDSPKVFLGQEVAGSPDDGHRSLGAARRLTLGSQDTIEEVARRILDTRRITRTDQNSLLCITLSQVTLKSQEKVLVDKVFDGLKLGILKVVD
ncbi:MAG: hypothetical protein EA367_19535 [Leptolyngbya sp. DLM2.Bin15]|nr:MAG: hypothetical protein EA367_19535 [Leptolyngbya sp. DLM2.Bin15]